MIVDGTSENSSSCRFWWNVIGKGDAASEIVLLTQKFVFISTLRRGDCWNLLKFEYNIAREIDLITI